MLWDVFSISLHHGGHTFTHLSLHIHDGYGVTLVTHNELVWLLGQQVNRMDGDVHLCTSRWLECICTLCRLCIPNLHEIKS